LKKEENIHYRPGFDNGKGGTSTELFGGNPKIKRGKKKIKKKPVSKTTSIQKGIPGRRNISTNFLP